MNSRKMLLFAAALLLVFSAACGGGGKTVSKTQVLSPEQEKLEALLPGDEVSGWAQEEDEVRFFDPDTLYELINGAAENFLIYGFEQLVTTYYNDQEDSESQIEVQIYEMKDPRNAFGIYASEINLDSEFMKIGAEGYLGSTALSFWADRYYVKITAFEENEDIKRALINLAESISRKIGAAGIALPELELFPKADMAPHSARYLAKDVLGQVAFSEGFEAKYKKGNDETKIVIVLPGGDEAAVKDALDKYKAFIASSTGGSVAREVTTPGDGGFVGKDSYYGNLAAIRSGNRIFISLGEASADKALAQVKACIK